MDDQPDGEQLDVQRIYSTQQYPAKAQSTVILGAGVIGCATAYYLSRSGNTKPDTIHLVEASPELFSSASGKSGGFLASDWFGPATASLAALSFELHKQLAEQHDGFRNWGYSKSTGASLMEDSQAKGPRADDWLRTGGSRAEAAGANGVEGSEHGPAWLTRRYGDTMEVISGEGTVAQLDPLRLSQFLLRQCISKGVRLHHPAKAVKISRDELGTLSGVRLRHGTGADLRIPCTRLVIAAGAWTPQVFRSLFPSSKLDIPISSLAGHSIVVRSPRWTRELESGGCHAIFTTMRNGFSPEIMSRAGEEIYVAGLNDASLPLPSSPAEAKLDRASIDELKAVAQKLLGKDGSDESDLQIAREGLCFRPVTSKGVPIMCRVQDHDLGGITTRAGSDGGVFIAAGHGPWGISQSLGTGKVMAEMLERQDMSADVGGLSLQ